MWCHHDLETWSSGSRSMKQVRIVTVLFVKCDIATWFTASNFKKNHNVKSVVMHHYILTFCSWEFSENHGGISTCTNCLFATGSGTGQSAQISVCLFVCLSVCQWYCTGCATLSVSPAQTVLATGNLSVCLCTTGSGWPIRTGQGAQICICLFLSRCMSHCMSACLSQRTSVCRSQCIFVSLYACLSQSSLGPSHSFLTTGSGTGCRGGAVKSEGGGGGGLQPGVQGSKGRPLGKQF